jgi:hypothetical protein
MAILDRNLLKYHEERVPNAVRVLLRISPSVAAADSTSRPSSVASNAQKRRRGGSNEVQEHP